MKSLFAPPVARDSFRLPLAGINLPLIINDVCSIEMDGVSKQLTVAVKNGNYRRVADITRC
jgi:hypothetical protein